MKDYSAEIEKAISEYENYHPYPRRTLDWISDRIDWCWKFRHITEKQMENYCDRMIVLYKRNH